MSKKAAPEFGDESGPSLHSARWRFGEFELDETQRELRLRGELLKIEAKPLNLLMLFLRHPGELITKNDLIDALWTGRIVTEAVLGNCVAKLRQTLGAEAGTWIRNVHGFGYRFDGPAQLVTDSLGRAVPQSLDLKPGDDVPLREGWQLVRRLGFSGDSWLAQHQQSKESRVYKFTRNPRSLVALKREVTIFRLLRETLTGSDFYVGILDWNFDEPPWFIEAEYCKGGSLQEWLESIGGAKKLPLRVRLEIVARVADALAQVHQIGVIHKDLKPGNILVEPSASGQPDGIRLGDFGSGRVLEPERLVALGISRYGVTESVAAGDSTSGTPLYYAPEVLAGQPPTIKSDLYALGILLYQLAVGDLRVVFAPGWERNIDEELLREDIAVVAEGDPALRLSDAAELARRIRSLDSRKDARLAELDGELQQKLKRQADIDRADAAERAMERMQARRSGLRVAVGALGLGFLVSAFLLVDARRARLDAEREAARAIAVTEFIAKDVFGVFDEQNRPPRDLTVLELLAGAGAKADERFADQPEIATAINAALGTSFQNLHSVYPSIERHEQVLAANDVRDARGAEAALNGVSSLITLRYWAGQLPPELSRYTEIVTTGTQRLGIRHPAVVQAVVSLAWGYNWLGDPAKAWATVSPYLDVDDVALDLETRGLAEYGGGWFLLEMGDYARAEKLLRAALDHLLSAPKHNAEDVSRAHTAIGRLLLELGDYSAAEQELQVGSSLAERMVGRTAWSYLRPQYLLASAAILQGRVDQGIAILERCLGAEDVLQEAGIDQNGPIRLALARALVLANRVDAARSLLLEAVSVAVKYQGVTHPATIALNLYLAELDQQSGELQGAKKILAEIDQLCARRLAELPPLMMERHWVSALVAVRERRMLDAKRSLGAALNISQIMFGSQHWRTRRVIAELDKIDG